MGQVLQGGAGQAPARQALLKAGLPDTTPATTINRVCGSGLKAIMLAAAAIRAGDAALVVAGGMESMNQGPYLLPKARFGYRLGNAELVDSTVHDGLWCAIEDCHMGTHAERVAVQRAASRAPTRTRFALESHRARSRPSTPAGSPTRSCPCPSATGPRDGARRRPTKSPRRDTSAEALARLKPVFDLPDRRRCASRRRWARSRPATRPASPTAPRRRSWPASARSSGSG